MVKKIRLYATDQVKILAKYMSKKGLLPKIYKKPFKLNNKKLLLLLLLSCLSRVRPCATP